MDDTPAKNALARVGEISGVHGVKGWVKIYSETAPKEKIFEYSPWLVTPAKSGVQNTECQVLEWQKAGKGLIAQLAGVEDRDQALAQIGSIIEVSTELFGALEEDSYYWYQLQGLQVVSTYQGKRTSLGIVEKLMETGANDVLVVRSENNQERFVPWTPGTHVLNVDLDVGEIEVDWDPDF